jgi:hypothetical protein
MKKSLISAALCLLLAVPAALAKPTFSERHPKIAHIGHEIRVFCIKVQPVMTVITGIATLIVLL